MEAKPHKTYPEQLELMKIRGMSVANEGVALELLQRAGYYTLSGYSYPFRMIRPNGERSDKFASGVTFEQVQLLWEFDNRLRVATFAALQHIETYMRALVAYSLGAIDPLIHLKPEMLSLDRPNQYEEWLAKLERAVKDSREEFIVHHRSNRNGVTPVLVASVKHSKERMRTSFSILQPILLLDTQASITFDEPDV